jgi:hypothetical protein
VLRLVVYILDDADGVECPRETDVGEAVDQRGDLHCLAVADFEVAERVGTELRVGFAERGEDAEDEKLTPATSSPVRV